MRFPDVSAFPDAEDVVRGVASVMLPHRNALIVDLRYPLHMMCQSSGPCYIVIARGCAQAARCCQSRFRSELPLEFGVFYNYSLQCCVVGESVCGSCADQAFFLFGVWPTQRKEYCERLCASVWLLRQQVACLLLDVHRMFWNRFVVQGVKGTMVPLAQMV